MQCRRAAIFLNEFRSPFRAVPHIRSPALIKIRLVAYHKYAALVLCKSPSELILRVLVEMVRRLVEQKHVGLAVYELAQAHLRLLSARKDAHEAFYVLCRKAALGER